MLHLPGHVTEADAVPDAIRNAQFDDLIKTVPRIIELLPDLFREGSDPRHRIALTEMVAGLVGQVKKYAPTVLVSISTSFFPCD